MQLARKIGQALLSATGVSLIAGGTILALHGFTAETGWIGPILGIGDMGIGLTLSVVGLALIVYSTRTPARSPFKRVRLHTRPNPRKAPAKPPQSAQDTASDLEALIRWDEESRKRSAPLAEDDPGSSGKPQRASQRES